MFGFTVDVAVADPRQQVGGDRRVRLGELVVGLGQPVVGRVARSRSSAPAGTAPRITGSGSRLVSALPSSSVGLPFRYLGSTQAPRRIASNVRSAIREDSTAMSQRRVADPEHEHPLALEHVGRLVVVDVHLLALEAVLAGKRRLRPARVPVVAVGDEDRVVGRPTPARRDSQLAPAHPPAAARAPARPASPRCESGSGRESRSGRRSRRSTRRSGSGSGSPGSPRASERSRRPSSAARC